MLYTAAGGEAIVVDPLKAPEKYNEWFSEVELAKVGSNRVRRSPILQSTLNLVSEKMKYSQSSVDEILSKYNASNNGDKIELSVFMEEGAGVRRHQALAVASLLYMAKEAGHI